MTTANPHSNASSNRQETPCKSKRTGQFILGGLLFLSLVFRLIWGVGLPSDEASLAHLPDQQEYLALGRHLIQSGSLWMADPRFEQIVYAYRTPGYPLLVAACDARPRVVRIVQSFIDTSTALAIYLLARRWLLPGGALFAAALVAFNPFLFFFSGLILSETLYTAMLCWGLAMLILSDGPWPPGNGLLVWLGGIVILALAILVRPGTLLLPIFLALGAALANRHVVLAHRDRWPLPIGATVLIVIFLVLFPWAARNRWVLGSWIWTATDAGITQFDGFNADATGASDQRFVQTMPWTKDMTEPGRSQYFADRAHNWIVQHPSDALRLALVKALRTWSPVPLGSEYGGRWIYRAVGLSFGVVFYVLALLGLWQEILPGAAKRVLLLPAIYFTIAAALSVGSLRYLVPAEGPMAVLAAGSVRSRRESIHPAER